MFILRKNKPTWSDFNINYEIQCFFNKSYFGSQHTKNISKKIFVYANLTSSFLLNFIRSIEIKIFPEYKSSHTFWSEVKLNFEVILQSPADPASIT